jgi:DNA-binding NtrC family response regulator
MPKARTLLLVDDEPLFLEAMSKVRGRHGIRALQACSGDEALRLLEESDPDAVVLEVKMPGQDGLSVLRCLKDRRPTTPVILLTGHGSVDVGRRALRLGAIDFQTKPVPVAKLLEVIEEAIRSRPLAEEAARREG